MASNEIVSYFHCKKCLLELPKGLSPADWSDQQAGWTAYGLQVWCNRHDTNIVAIDFNKVADVINREVDLSNDEQQLKDREEEE